MKGYWGFDNDCARNVVIFNAEDSSSFHIDNPKNSFLVLGTKKFSINFSKANTKFCLSFPCNGSESYLYVNNIH